MPHCNSTSEKKTSQLNARFARLRQLAAETVSINKIVFWICIAVPAGLALVASIAIFMTDSITARSKGSNKFVNFMARLFEFALAVAGFPIYLIIRPLQKSLKRIKEGGGLARLARYTFMTF